MIVFADTSALASVYLGDETDGSWIARVLFEGADPVVVCELVDVELPSALARSERDSRIDRAGVRKTLQDYAAHTADDGPIGVAPVTRETIAKARTIVLDSPVRTLDALHLAAAQILGEASGEALVLLTRDSRQADAAFGLGLDLYETPRI